MSLRRLMVVVAICVSAAAAGALPAFALDYVQHYSSRYHFGNFAPGGHDATGFDQPSSSYGSIWCTAIDRSQMYMDHHWGRVVIIKTDGSWYRALREYGTFIQ